MQQYKINGKVHLTFPNGHCCYKNGYWFFTSNFVLFYHYSICLKSEIIYLHLFVQKILQLAFRLLKAFFALLVSFRVVIYFLQCVWMEGMEKRKGNVRFSCNMSLGGFYN